MYQLIGLDTIARIAIALAVLFVLVPRLAWRPVVRRGLLEQFWWNFGVGLTLLTLAGQLLTLFHLDSAMTLLLLLAVVVVTGRSIQLQRRPVQLLSAAGDRLFLALLNIAEGRVSLRRRARKLIRNARRRLDDRLSGSRTRLEIIGWVGLIAIASALRFYRPMASANLGFSDTYVHLYLVKLLEEGRQVDPAWGPYPRGMHFLLLAIRQLTNADEIVLMNFFGAFVGVLIVIAVADAACRLSGRVSIGLVAGLLFATLVGGARQYFFFGGAFATTDAALGRRALSLSYDAVPRSAGEFDIALTSFQRQTSTLSQEMAIVFLFPAVMFLLAYFRRRDRWNLVGFAGCTAALAAVHSGVLVPLVVLCALATVAALVERVLTPVAFRRAVAAGAVAVVIGSLWALAFIAYPYAGRKSALDSQSHVGSTALFYFPMLRSIVKFENEPARVETTENRTMVALTPPLSMVALIAAALVISAFFMAPPFRGNAFWIGSAALVLLLFHFSSRLRLPEIIETRRNTEWLTMTLMVTLGMAVAAFVRLILRVERIAVRRTALAAGALLLVAWVVRVPRLDAGEIHERLTSYSGYGATALAVLQIERRLEPYSWTLVSYGQEFPMVLKRGFHVPAADFLAQYDPLAPDLRIPTPHVFIVVERVPHHFQINDWAARFSRSDIEERLQTWCTLYQMTHRDMRMTYADADVRVYAIERSRAESDRIAAEGARR